MRSGQRLLRGGRVAIARSVLSLARMRLVYEAVVRALPTSPPVLLQSSMLISCSDY